MDTNRWQRIKEIFRAALDRAPEDRPAYLEEACGSDAELQMRVESLLASHEETETFLELPTVRSENLAGKRLGQYLLESIISSGGMGTVYEAMQEHPNRTVAVKIMHQGIASSSALRRFEYEAEILGRLRHANIAQIIEAGTHGEMPYFVMEYIPDAMPVTRYAWKRELSMRERLALFLQVCDAVHHGHQKGIIHRDLKPSNILVDANGQVKVIDFGVARTTDSDLILTTAHTDVGQLIGTVQYMSPEQCRANPDELDTRSDVYALGVVLYELLCEELPYDVRETAIYEATRLICEDEPKRPSTMRRALKGDMETILLKTLEKEKTHRYQTVAELGADISRYLNGEVIHAKPAGPATRIYKIVKRNPVLSASLGVAVAAPIGFFLYVVLWSYPLIKEERNRAVEAWNEADHQRAEAIDAEAEAEREAEKATAINRFLADMLAAARPGVEGRDVRVVEVLDRAAMRIGSDFADQPDVAASLRHTIGDTYESLGQFEEAESQLNRSLQIYTELYGGEHRDTLSVETSLGTVIIKRGRIDVGLEILSETLEKHRQCLGEEDTQTLLTQSLLAWAHLENGNIEEAEAEARSAIEGLTRNLSRQNPQTFSARNTLNYILIEKGEYAEAETLLNGLISDQRRVLGEEEPLTLVTMFTLARVLTKMGRHPEAVTGLRKIIEIDDRIYGSEHPNTLMSMQSLADTLAKMGKIQDAENLFRKVLEIRRRVLGENHPNTLNSMSGLAAMLKDQGRYEEAEEVTRDVLDRKQRLLGSDDLSTLRSMNVLAVILIKMGRVSEAEPLFHEILETRRRLLGTSHPETLSAVSNLGNLFVVVGRFDEAETLVRGILESGGGEMTEANITMLSARTMLADILNRQNRLEESQDLYCEILEVQRRAYGNDSLKILNTLHSLGVVYLKQEKGVEAETVLQEATTLARLLLSEKTTKRWRVQMNYGFSLLKQDRLEEAEPVLLESTNAALETFGAENPNTQYGVSLLVDLYESWEKPEQAAQWMSRMQ